MDNKLDDNWLNQTYEKFHDREKAVLADIKNGVGNESRKEKEFNYLTKISMTILKMKNYLKKVKDMDDED